MSRERKKKAYVLAHGLQLERRILGKQVLQVLEVLRRAEELDVSLIRKLAKKSQARVTGPFARQNLQEVPNHG